MDLFVLKILVWRCSLIHSGWRGQHPAVCRSLHLVLWLRLAFKCPLQPSSSLFSHPGVWSHSRVANHFPTPHHPKHSPGHQVMTIQCLASLLWSVRIRRQHASMTFVGFDRLPWMAGRQILFHSFQCAWWFSYHFCCLFCRNPLIIWKSCRQFPDFSSDHCIPLLVTELEWWSLPPRGLFMRTRDSWAFP